MKTTQTNIVTKRTMLSCFVFALFVLSGFSAHAQTNAANRGYNLVTKYHDPDYVCMDEVELRLAALRQLRSEWGGRRGSLNSPPPAAHAVLALQSSHSCLSQPASRWQVAHVATAPPPWRS